MMSLAWALAALPAPFVAEEAVPLVTVVKTSAPKSDPITLGFKAPAGFAARFQLNVGLTVSDADLTYRALIEQTVAERGEGGHSVRSQHSGAVLTHAGQEVNYENVGPTTTFYRPSGWVWKIEGEQVTEADYRLQTLNPMIWPTEPVRVGDAWTVTVPADPARGTQPIEAKFELVHRETALGMDAAKIRFRVVEKRAAEAGTSTGTAWIEIATGMPIRVETGMVNAPMVDQVVTAKWSMVRVVEPAAP
ncbi:MAG: hypothetical protein MH204_00870 [Fimbriimonadaceae bacterium]|nr:hypothetical protein [Fimbriimonadaceae bacterium]